MKHVSRHLILKSETQMNLRQAKHNMQNYLFVDGGYLDDRMADYSKFYGKTAKIRYTSLLNAASAGVDKGFYYDSYPTRKAEESQTDFENRYSLADQKFDEIARTPFWQCNFGFTKGKGRRQRQKSVDVQLAVDALTHAIRGNCKKITLLTGEARSHVQGR